MNGIHDVGGMHGLGPIPIDPKEAVFRAPWERDVFSVIGLYFAGGLCPLDEFRHSIETMDAAEYLATPYYVHWLHAAELLGQRYGLFSREELEKRVSELRAKEAFHA
jgi:hypothetical protein